MPVTILYIDFTVPDDSHTGKLFMNYFYDYRIQKFYITLIYQVYLKTFYYSAPKENIFLQKILINGRCYFKINNETLQGKRTWKQIWFFVCFLSFLCKSPSPNFVGLVEEKVKWDLLARQKWKWPRHNGMEQYFTYYKWNSKEVNSGFTKNNLERRMGQ